ncbi:transglycosylase SLT domain-containing protein [Burkholderia glumae]|uniref:transglycosylase SLT domain-containing protein n=1 Tax=Burkholderia glumae TaxID=337 RepID=UPI00055CD21E|nr:transglycosylase SLT domain-containing protein [Burkholderia glumae]QKM53688.1 Membrane-bound lytic murein transglycosylase C [Burkholderia glumae]
MNAWLSWRPSERHAQLLREVLRRGTRVSHHLFSVVGGLAVVVAFALWMLPNARGTLAAKLMPVLSAAVKAGPARLLSGHPLPAFGPGNADEDVDADGSPVSPVSYAPSGPAAGDVATADDAGRNGQSPVTLAKLIPAQRVAADARDDRVFTSREQALVATYLARRYHVAQEPVGQLVKAAFQTGHDIGLDPMLLLAVMAIESGFNPYAESGVGAQGLMQVMSKIHSDKFEYAGGTDAALRPVVNIQVGALVLKDCIARGGSLAGGLRLYNGVTGTDDGGYSAKVLAERGRLRDVARGRNVSIYAPQLPAPVTTAASGSSSAPAAGQKRVQATLDGAHPIASKASAPVDAKTSSQSDASADTGAKHDGSSEVGT